MAEGFYIESSHKGLQGCRGFVVDPKFSRIDVEFCIL